MGVLVVGKTLRPAVAVVGLDMLRIESREVSINIDRKWNYRHRERIAYEASGPVFWSSYGHLTQGLTTRLR